MSMPPPPPPGGSGFPPAMPPQPTSTTPKTLGIIAIIVGTLGVVVGCCWVLGIPISIAAIIMAGVGYSQIKDIPDHPDRTLLVVALVMSALSTAVTLLGIGLRVLRLLVA